MIIQQFYVDGIAHTSYLLGGARNCAIVDPQRDVDIYIATAKNLGLRITHILETHLHADFVSGHLDLADRSGARIYAPKSGRCRYDHVAVADGEDFEIDHLHLSVLDTPGHTPDGVCYVVADGSRGKEPAAVFTGDTLFVGDVGRPDLFPGKGETLASQLHASLHRKLMSLPDFCEVYPAHGAGSLCGRAMSAKRWSTIGYEKRFNSALQHPTEAEFKKSLLEDMPEAPDHFARCSEINRQGAPLVAGLAAPRPLSPGEFRSLADAGHLVVDTRDYPCFGGGHIPGAYSLNAAINFPTFAGWLLRPDQPILLVVTSEVEIPSLAVQLRRVGLDQLVGYLQGGMAAWSSAGFPIETLPQMNVQEVKRRCDAGESLIILDVRARSEWEAAHIEGATHMAMPDTRSRYGELDPEKPTMLMCRGGARATAAGSILKHHGLRNLFVVPGGMSAWVAAGYAPECPTCSLTHGPRFA